ncbi:DoxX family protein [Gelidibacter salicanalis]|uniref:Methylamine utilisation protein MauE domain-containing protein n=1 Tax=Gelidibacter salicanalis TaxID=291193 RepID=A0A934NIJ4_9FLAO|nr:MauE/DoxX family redox-associated membrane protein [Gelidibacter salicanalis]MBJ7880154.1 hypothetical protein [Gelidibacter salicanalis]
MLVPKSFLQKIPWVVSLLFVLLFVYAAVSKFLDFQTFETQLGQSPILAAFAGFLSWGVILMEIIIAVLLSLHKTRLLGLYIAFLLMVLFTSYIVIILNFTPFVPCSCGGVLEALGWTEHLVLNIVFIALAIWAIYIMDKASLKKVVLRLSVMVIMGIGMMIVLFLTSEKEIKRNNAFQRKYIPHALKKIGEYQLESNAFYFAGVDGSAIYLGNYNAPLYLKELGRDLKKVRDLKIEIDTYELPYKRVRIEVAPPHFFIGDGTVPILFKGETKNWEAKTFSKDDAFFYQFAFMDSTSLAILTTSTKTKSNTLGVLHKDQDDVHLELHPQVLKNQLDGTFDTDGMLLWNDQTKQVLYIYYYRNQYEVADKDLTFEFTGKTIDTVSKAKLDIARYTANDESKLGNAVLVNRYADTYGENLYINSDRLGKYEDDEVLKSAGIIDQYDIKDNAYVHSFYFYHQPGEKLREFKVFGDIIIGLVNDKLWVYRLKPEPVQ